MGDTTATTQPNTCTAPIPRDFRALRLDASRTIDGGYSVRVYYRTGGGEVAELSFTEANRDTYRARYRYIAEQDLAGENAETIATEIAVIFDAAQALTAVGVAR